MPPQFGKTLRLAFKLPEHFEAGPSAGVGHSDTVWPLGTSKHMPVNEADGSVMGSGRAGYESRAGVFRFAMRALLELNVAVKRQRGAADCSG